MISSSNDSQLLSHLGTRILQRLAEAAKASVILKKMSRQRNPESSASWRIELQLVGPAAMSRLNKRYRGKTGPTDVLSFPSASPFREAGYLGDLVICIPTLKDQAEQHRHSQRAELEILLVHGFLHLLGFDHETGRKDAKRMQQWEKRLLKKKGQGAKSPALLREPECTSAGLIARSS